jgi:2-isopropylmalate synthase
MRRINVFDTTLRDGQQSPGSAIDLEKKIEVARQLYRLNVDVIEAGFPVASKADFDCVRVLSTELKDISICAFARAKKGDIEVAAEALNGCSNGRIQIVTPVSDLHLKTRLGKDRQQGLDLIKDSLKVASDLFAEVSWIAEDSSRADPSYLLDAFNIAVECGAKFVTYADTVGYSLPQEISKSISSIVNSINSKAQLGIHCHNDLGLAVANTLSSISSGAQEVQCTINGIGERAGNASLEEIIMAIQVRKNSIDAFTNVDSRLLGNTCDLVSKFTNSPIAKNKPIVGENAFAHCSGMHQHGVLVNSENYEIIKPSEVGRKGNSIVIGKHSGKHGVKHILKESGLSIKEDKLNVLMQKIKLLEDGKYLSSKELVRLLEIKNGT